MELPLAASQKLVKKISRIAPDTYCCFVIYSLEICMRIQVVMSDAVFNSGANRRGGSDRSGISSEWG